MGRYIEEILQPGEKLLYSTTVHWIVYLPGILGWVAALAALAIGYSTENGTLKVLAMALAIVLALYGAAMVLRGWFRRWTTEFDVTDRRIVHKAGFVRRRTMEMNMDKVESVDVIQSILGRMLNYGEVVVRGVGESWEPILTIGSPLEFRNHITAR
ncbi:MAG: PH domain-containing protein [Xanthobacteraceae bacterium]|nr:MAG: PH domain-containing protein [Xanthobacteraceae bacterium]